MFKLNGEARRGAHSVAIAVLWQDHGVNKTRTSV